MSTLSPDIPYGCGFLEPAMSRETLWFHFGQHERGCYEPAINLVRGTDFDGLDLEPLLIATAHSVAYRTLHAHAAGVWNHNFFWRSMVRGGGGPPRGALADRVRAAFGSYAGFVRDFTTAAMTLIGNGWLWVTWDGTSVGLVTTANLDTPIVVGIAPLLVLDLWEHAYYLDHQNRRAAYVAAFLDELVNWEFASQNLEQISGGTRLGDVRVA
jgi:Fe-Mn family superoxide dismutase